MDAKYIIMQVAKEMMYYTGNTSVKIQKYIFDVLTTVRVVKVFGRFHRFPAQSLSVSGRFCVICIENMLHSP